MDSVTGVVDEIKNYSFKPYPKWVLCLMRKMTILSNDEVWCWFFDYKYITYHSLLMWMIGLEVEVYGKICNRNRTLVEDVTRIKILPAKTREKQIQRDRVAEFWGIDQKNIDEILIDFIQSPDTYKGKKP